MMTNNQTPFSEKLSVRSVRRSMMLLPWALPLSALALGIGIPTIEPHLGEPLRLEIPLIRSANEPLPTRDCVKLSYHADDPEGENFLKNGQVSITSKNGTPLLIVQSAQGVSSPFIGFRVKINCDAHISRDFMLMTSPGKLVKQTAPALPSGATAQPSTTLASAPAKTSNAKLSDPAGVLVISRNTTLNKMAHWRYPSSIGQRDKFRQMIAQANPELFANAGDRVGSVPVPEGTRLNIPEGLPTWASASPASLPTQENSNTPTAAEASSKSPQPPAPAATHVTPSTAPPSNGRLIIGSGRVPALTVQEFRQTLDRLEQLMNDKTRTESALSDTLTSLISSFGEVKKYLTLVDERLTKSEAEQQRLRTEMQSLRDDLQHSFNWIELLIAIIGGGAMGAGLVLFFRHRLYPQSSYSSPSSSSNTSLQDTNSSSNLNSSYAHSKAPLSTPAPSVKKSEPRLSDTPIQSPEHKTSSPSPSNAPITVPQEPTTEQTTKQATATAASPVTPPASSTTSVEFSASTSSTTASSVAPLNTELQIPAAQNESASSPIVPIDSPLHPATDPAIELADLMMSLGLAQEAARALLEHIQQNQHQDPAHWFKVLDIYRKTNQRGSFEKIAQDLNKALNVAVSPWEAPASTNLPSSLEDYPHLMTQLQSLWLKPECEIFLIRLLEDNRNGQRTGFPQVVIEEIMLLRSLFKTIPAMDFPAIDLG